MTRDPRSADEPTTPGPCGTELFVDLYELTMFQAYLAGGLVDDATFDLTVRSLPPGRGYLVAAGLDPLLTWLQDLRFTEASIAALRESTALSEPALEALSRFRFTGEVQAVPEGTVVFPGEPFVQLTAPLPAAQLVETYAMNRVHLETLAASKASRVVTAAAGRPVVDFGARRMHGTDAAVSAARAHYIAGAAGTSNVLAGERHGLPLFGTMAHSWIQAHASEADAFAAFIAEFPDTVLLVDTYDTIEGVREVIRQAHRLGDAFRVRAVRLDSGDLDALSRATRSLLDHAGLGPVEIFASGGLDEWKIDALVRAAAPIDGFGVGTRMGVSHDAPSLDLAYKLCEYAGRPRMKLSAGKASLPGRKQVYRVHGDDGVAVRDIVALEEERVEGTPLLRTVMRDGRRLPDASESLDTARERHAVALRAIPARCREIDPREPPYPVDLSAGLAASRRTIASALGD